MDESSKQRQFEDQFLNQLRARAQVVTKGPIPADNVVVEAMPDGLDAVRDALERLEVYDRDTLEKLPGKRCVQFRFRRSVLGGLFQRTVSRLRAQVLAPIDELVAGSAPGPVDREQVLNALARYELLPRRERPSAVAFASATGFSDSARGLVASSGNPTLILMGGREDGGWDVEMPEALRRSHWGKLFELESQDEKLKRLMHHLEQNESLLDSRGLSVAELSEKLGLERAKTVALVRRACRADSRLMTVVHDKTIHVCRTPLGEDATTMSIWSRIRKLLRLKPTVAERVRELTGQRVKLEQQRHEIDRKTDAFEADEREALKQGAAAASAAERKQVAGKLLRTRRSLKRMRTQAAGFTQQIDIIGTHIHHLTLAEQAGRVELPKAEELTAKAAEAEQVMAELSANADLAANIEIGIESTGMAEEEASIMAEFAQIAEGEAAAKPPVDETVDTAEEPAAPTESAREERSAAVAPPEPQRTKSADPAKPELS
ncbi:MAG: hypothetical protein IH986_04140 [Planctomycetes bacterium]|nr:hypothetical protein [Planctomycetota bacterium]